MNDMNDKQIVGRKKKLSIGLLFLVSVSVLGLVSILIINLFVTSSVKDKIITVDEAALYPYSGGRCMGWWKAELHA
jgi:hypothetical protein